MNGVEFQEGDLVEAEKKEIASSTRLRGVLKRVYVGNASRESLVVQAQGYEPDVEWLESVGFTVTVLEKAKPKLPDEPGVYIPVGGEIWNQTPLFLVPGGHWQFVNGSPAEETAKIWQETGLVRLEPVAETARRILDRIRSDNTGDGGYYDHRYTGKQLRALFAEFGVES